MQKAGIKKRNYKENTMNEKAAVITKKKEIVTDNTIPNTWDTLEMSYSDTDAQIKELNKQKATIKKTILEKFEKEFGHQGQSITSNLNGNKLQRVLNILQDIDETKLKNAISKDIFESITLPKVSMELFHSAVKMGFISAIQVNDVTTTKEVEKIVVYKSKE